MSTQPKTLRRVASVRSLGSRAHRRPQLVFFSELPRKELARMQVFYPRVFEQLAALDAEVSVGLIDMSPERAALCASAPPRAASGADGRAASGASTRTASPCVRPF